MSKLEELFKNSKLTIKSSNIFERELESLNDAKIMVGELIMPLKMALFNDKTQNIPLIKTVEIVEEIFLRLNAVQLYIQLAKIHTEKLMDYRKRYSKCSNKEDSESNEKRLVKALHRVKNILENKVYAKLILQSGHHLVKMLQDIYTRNENGMVDPLAMYRIQSPLEYYFKAKITQVLGSFEQIISDTNYSLGKATELAKISGFDDVKICGTGVVVGHIIEETFKLDDITIKPIENLYLIINERICSLGEVEKQISGVVDDEKTEPDMFSEIYKNIVSIFSV
ncbi:uncharacterized protein TA03535 [Theileria annulata]|uniref:Uncharacterized protein n=1 Tax=Theileria annulata TaxID=5874 RepID=Q4UCI9_THEAN|nr:uncharacterized protein TA03535 [Theileria annulata]CAI75462.1 hypothetical protein TA03535 [Theileria annulata]|eukprot:XP_954938.1 hypothetical protein TA03535 [Theileria annulata]